MWRFYYGAVFLGWYITACAAEKAPPNLLLLPWTSIGIGILLSLWGGLAATIGKFGVMAESAARWHEFGKDMVCSAVAGTGSYFVCAQYDFGIWQVALTQLVAGYSGTRFIDGLVSLVDKFRAGKA